MDLVLHHLAYYSNINETPHNTALLVDSDSQMFVNYLFFPIDGAEGVPDEFRHELKQHGEMICDRLREFSADPGIWSKYAWAGLYHNHFCNHLPSAGDLIIDPTLLNQPPRFIGQVYRRKGRKILRGDEEVATLKYLPEWKVEKEPD